MYHILRSALSCVETQKETRSDRLANRRFDTRKFDTICSRVMSFGEDVYIRGILRRKIAQFQFPERDIREESRLFRCFRHTAEWQYSAFYGAPVRSPVITRYIKTYVTRCDPRCGEVKRKRSENTLFTIGCSISERRSDDRSADRQSEIERSAHDRRSEREPGRGRRGEGAPIA